MLEIGRMNEVVALFGLDKGNYSYKEIIPHTYSYKELEASDEFHYDDDYFYLSNVPVIQMTTAEIKELAGKLLDLPDMLQNYKDTMDERNKRTISCSTFIATDGVKHLLVLTGGYVYPRFKAMIDESSAEKIKDIIKKQEKTA